MEKDLEDFLKARGVSEESINAMKQDKIDKSVLALVKDEQMAKYLSSYGDRVAVLAFCHQTQTTAAEKESLLQRVREKLKNRKVTSKLSQRLGEKGKENPIQGSSMARPRNQNAEKASRKIEIGWLNFCNDGYQQVRTAHGGGTRHVTVEKDSTVEQILVQGKDLFFPNGLSTKGDAANFTFSICDFKRNTLPLADTVGHLYEETKLRMLRFYICTKSAEFSNDSGSESDAAKSSPDVRETLEEEPTSDHVTADEDLPLQRPASKRSRRLSPLPDSPEVPSVNRALGDQEDTLLWDEEHGTLEDDEVIIINWNLNKTDETEVLVHTDVAVPNTSSHGQPLLSNEAPHEIFETNLQPVNSEIFPSEEPGSANPEVHYICVHRVTIVKDLVMYFLDPDITKYTLRMEFLNENASDDSGVSRDVYSAFWEKFLEQCEGEEERVPRLKPDCTEEEWQAVGRIWAKGFIDHGVLPVRLSKSFILASIHGIDTVDVNVLMSSFLNYLSGNERGTVERALEGKLEESDEEDLLDLFARMGSQCLPPKDNLVSVIQTMAHKAILQEPKYIDCFSKALSCVQLILSDKRSVLAVYEMKRATGKKVAQLLQTSNEILSQQEQSTFNHIQRYVRSADQKKVEQFLRFCTGSSSMCVDKITVYFNAEYGLNRRPVAHTCAATLELSYMYSSYPEFRTELDNILSSNYLTMDII